MAFLVRKAHTLSSTDGQYRGPRLWNTPEYIGERSSPLRMISWVSPLVKVRWQGICSWLMDGVRNENGGGGSSPGWISSAE